VDSEEDEERVEVDERAIYFINFVADFWDMIEVFHKIKKEGRVREKRSVKHRDRIHSSNLYYNPRTARVEYYSSCPCTIIPKSY
jgi:hypothetical protein